MNWQSLLWYFSAGMFTANALPHLVAGVLGRPFQTPFAKPPGKGLSSSTVNVLWGWFNLSLACLMAHYGVYDPHRPLASILPFAFGALQSSLFSANHFGKFHGGTAPHDS